MEKQISNVRINCFTNNGVKNVAFQGFPVTIETQDGSFRFSEKYYGGTETDEVLSGKLRSRLRGYRLEGELNWEDQLNFSNYYAVSDAITQGTEKKFWSGINIAPADDYTAVILDASNGSYQNDQFNNMIADFNGADARLVTDSFSNGMITLNALVTFSGGTTVINISTTKEMVSKTTLNVATQDKLVIAQSMGYAVELEGQITTTPSAIRILGEDIDKTYPKDFRK